MPAHTPQAHFVHNTMIDALERFHSGSPRALYIDMQLDDATGRHLGGTLPYADAYATAWSLDAAPDPNPVRKMLVALMALQGRTLRHFQDDGTHKIHQQFG